MTSKASNKSPLSTLYVFHVEEFQPSFQKINLGNYSIQFSWSMVTEGEFIDVLDEEESIKSINEIYKTDFSNRCYFVSNTDRPLYLIISITTSTRTFESPKIPVSAVCRSAWFSFSEIELCCRSDSISLSLFGACQDRWTKSRLKRNEEYEIEPFMTAGQFVRNLRVDPQVVFLESVLTKQVSDLKTQQDSKIQPPPGDVNESPPVTESCFGIDEKGFPELMEKMEAATSNKWAVANSQDAWDTIDLQSQMHENKNGRYLLKNVLEKLRFLDVDEKASRKDLEEILCLLKKAKSSFSYSQNRKALQQLEELEVQIESIAFEGKLDVENDAPCAGGQRRRFSSVRESYVGHQVEHQCPKSVVVRKAERLQDSGSPSFRLKDKIFTREEFQTNITSPKSQEPSYQRVARTASQPTRKTNPSVENFRKSEKRHAFPPPPPQLVTNRSSLANSQMSISVEPTPDFPWRMPSRPNLDSSLARHMPEPSTPHRSLRKPPPGTPGGTPQISMVKFA